MQLCKKSRLIQQVMIKKYQNLPGEINEIKKKTVDKATKEVDSLIYRKDLSISVFASFSWIVAIQIKDLAELHDYNLKRARRMQEIKMADARTIANYRTKRRESNALKFSSSYSSGSLDLFQKVSFLRVH